LGNLSTPKSVQKLQMALHAKAKAEAGYRFYALYDKISREDILAHAYAQCLEQGRPGCGRPDLRGRRGLWGGAVAWSHLLDFASLSPGSAESCALDTASTLATSVL
jgi:hypothetical protein